MLTPDYTDLEKARDFLRLVKTDDDQFVKLDVTTSSRAVDRTCHRSFGRTDDLVLLKYRAWYSSEDRLWKVDIRDVWTTDGLVVTVGGTVITEYDLLPDTAAIEGRPWERIEFKATAERQPTGTAREVGVLGKVGWKKIPEPVELACLLQTSRLNERRKSPYGIAGSPQNGSELRLLERVDPDVAVSLKHYIRRWAAA